MLLPTTTINRARPSQSVWLCVDGVERLTFRTYDSCSHFALRSLPLCVDCTRGTQNPSYPPVCASNVLPRVRVRCS